LKLHACDITEIIIKKFTLKRTQVSMKKPITSLLCLAMLYTSAPMFAEEDINIIAQETDDLWRAGAGAQDGAYTSLSLSMLGWGLGLAAGIGILASVLHQSTSSSSHDTCNTHNH